MHLNKNSIVDRGWESMEQILDKEMPQKKKRRFFVWWLVGLFFISTSGLYLAYSQFFKSNTIVQTNTDLSHNDAISNVIENSDTEEELSINKANQFIEPNETDNPIGKNEVTSTQLNKIVNTIKSDYNQESEIANKVNIDSNKEAIINATIASNSIIERTEPSIESDLTIKQTNEAIAELRKVTTDKTVTNDTPNPNLQNIGIQAQSDLNPLAKKNSIEYNKDIETSLDPKVDHLTPASKESEINENDEGNSLPNSNTELNSGAIYENQKLIDAGIQKQNTSKELSKATLSELELTEAGTKTLIDIASLPLKHSYLITDPSLPSKLPVIVYTPIKVKFQPFNDIRLGLYAGYMYRDKTFSGEVNGTYTRKLSQKWALGIGIATGINYHKSENRVPVLTNAGERFDEDMDANQLPTGPQGPQGTPGVGESADPDLDEGFGGSGGIGATNFELTEELRQELSEQNLKSSQYISTEGILLFAPSDKIELSASLGYDYLYEANFDDIFLVDKSFLSFEVQDNAESINLTVPEKWLPMSQFYVSYAINRRLKLSAGLKYFYKQIFPESGPNLNQFKFGIQTVIPMRRK